MATTYSNDVFCDEAGFTGDNLLDSKQPLFAYAAVKIEPAQAAELAKEIRTLAIPQASELKGRLLFPSRQGPKGNCSGPSCVGVRPGTVSGRLRWPGGQICG